MTCLSPTHRAGVVSIPIALTFTVTHGTTRIGRKRRTQRGGDPRIRTRDRIRRNRGSVDALRLGCVGVTSLLILRVRAGMDTSVELCPVYMTICSGACRYAGRRRRSRPNRDIAGRRGPRGAFHGRWRWWRRATRGVHAVVLCAVVDVHGVPIHVFVRVGFVVRVSLADAGVGRGG